jgi:asparagine synthase (glutamine-hydrolysing)
LRTYSFRSDRFPEVDEREFIRAVVEMYGLRHSWFSADEVGVLSDLDRWLPVFSEPVFRASDPVFYPVLDAARADGARVVLTGDGSDPAFTGSSRYFAARLARGRLASLHGQIAAAANGPTFSMKRRVYNYGLLVLEDVLLPYAPTGLSKRGDAVWKQLHRRRKEMPAGLDGRVPDVVPYFSGKDAWWYELRRDITLVWPWQHEYFDRLMRRFGLEVRYPLLDIRLVELVLRTPPAVLFKDGRTKALLRDALAGILPPLLSQRWGNPNLIPLIELGLRRQHSGFVRQVLEHPEVERRGYVKDGWSGRLLEYVDGRADRFPDWPGFVVELWLRNRAGRLTHV